MSDLYGSATYSPEDNKLRLYPAGRLPADIYARVRAAGFIWAPKQELFVAPAWSPEREDLLEELAGEVGDEDKSLTERAEERAERFEDYSERRADDAQSARAAVSAIADGIPLGQPILIGHHSERHARKDAERIENGMRRAVKMWETSKYWADRAAGAVRLAKYKERPDVRARRIKKLEAHARRQAKTIAQHNAVLKFWSREDLTAEKAAAFCNYFDHGSVNLPDGASHWSAWSALTDGKITVEDIRAQRLAELPQASPRLQRWADHFAHRLEYERALLAESGGILADRIGPEVGGAARAWCSPGGSHGSGWSYIVKVNKVTVSLLDDPGYVTARLCIVKVPFDKLAGIMPRAEVEAARASGCLLESEKKDGFFILGPQPETVERAAPTAKPVPVPSAESEFSVLKETLRAGVKVITAPQLFPTPPALAREVVARAGGLAGRRVLEPSAGTGNLVSAIINAATGADCVQVVAVEINPGLVQSLEALRARTVYARPENFDIRQADFLGCNGDLGKFDRVVMNPPFENGADILHIQHARHFLKPGGRLVALCANGPRQREKLMPEASEWVDLPPGSFKESGTMVNAAIAVFEGPRA